MTNREFYNAIINGEINADIISHATAEIAKLDAKNLKRTSPNSKDKVEFANRVAIVWDILKASTSPLPSADIVAVSGLTQGQVTACTKRLIEEGKITKSTIKMGKSSRVCYMPILGA